MSRPPARTPRLAAATRLRRAPTLRRRVPTHRPRVLTPRLHVPTRRRVAVTLHLRTRLLPARTPRLAAVMAAEAVGVTTVVVAEVHKTAEAAAPEAVGEGRAEAVLTGTKLLQLKPAPNSGRAFFVACLRDASARNSWATHVFSKVTDPGPFLIGHGEKAR